MIRTIEREKKVKWKIVPRMIKIEINQPNLKLKWPAQIKKITTKIMPNTGHTLARLLRIKIITMANRSICIRILFSSPFTAYVYRTYFKSAFFVQSNRNFVLNIGLIRIQKFGSIGLCSLQIRKHWNAWAKLVKSRWDTFFSGSHRLLFNLRLLSSDELNRKTYIYRSQRMCSALWSHENYIRT